MTDPARPQHLAAVDRRDEVALRAALGSSGAQRPAEQLDFVLADQKRRWLSGSGWPAERYFACAPQIAAVPVLRAELLAGEIACRSEIEPADPAPDVLARFPADAAAVLALRTAQAEQAAASTLQRGDAPGPAQEEPPEGGPRFRVERELGSGAFGQVVLAFDQQLHRRVALKRPRTDRWSDAGLRDAFLREARHVARLHHPGIVALYDVVAESPATLTIVMEYLDGASLAQRLTQQRPRAHESLDWIRQAAEAVHYAHEHGLVHRDLKPANLLIDAQGQCRVTDFGLAIEPTGASGELAGTPAYMAPEFLSGAGGDGARGDVWSLGVTLYELLTGARPFVGRSPHEIAAAIQAGGALDRLLQHPCVPADVRPILRRCLQPDPQNRYPSAAALASDLRALHAQWLAPAQGPGPSRARALWTAGLCVLGLLVWCGCLDALWAGFRVDYEYPSDVLSLCGAVAVMLPLTLGLGGTWAALWTKDWFRRRRVVRALAARAELPELFPVRVVQFLAVGCGSLGWGPLALLMQAWLGPLGLRDARRAGALRGSLRTMALGAGLSVVGNLAWFVAAERSLDFYRAFVHGDRGRAEATAGDWAAAVDEYSAGLTIEPTIAWLYLERGRAHAARQDWAAARADYERSIEIYREMLAWSSPLTQRLPEAQQALEQLPADQ